MAQGDTRVMSVLAACTSAAFVCTLAARLTWGWEGVWRAQHLRRNDTTHTHTNTPPLLSFLLSLRWLIPARDSEWGRGRVRGGWEGREGKGGWKSARKRKRLDSHSRHMAPGVFLLTFYFNAMLIHLRVSQRKSIPRQTWITILGGVPRGDFAEHFPSSSPFFFFFKVVLGFGGCSYNQLSPTLSSAPVCLAVLFCCAHLMVSVREIPNFLRVPQSVSPRITDRRPNSRLAPNPTASNVFILWCEGIWGGR